MTGAPPQQVQTQAVGSKISAPRGPNQRPRRPRPQQPQSTRTGASSDQQRLAPDKLSAESTTSTGNTPATSNTAAPTATTSSSSLAAAHNEDRDAARSRNAVRTPSRRLVEKMNQDRHNRSQQQQQQQQRRRRQQGRALEPNHQRSRTRPNTARSANRPASTNKSNAHAQNTSNRSSAPIIQRRNDGKIRVQPRVEEARESAPDGPDSSRSVMDRPTTNISKAVGSKKVDASPAKFTGQNQRRGLTNNSSRSTTTRANANTNSARPGAHAIQGPGVSVRDANRHRVPTDMSLAERQNDIQIPVAFVVDNQDDKDIVHAVETRRMMSRRNIVCIVLAALVVVIGVVLGIVFGLGLTNDSSEGASTSTDTASTSTAPTTHTRSSLLELIKSESRSTSIEAALAVTDPTSPQGKAYEWVWKDGQLAAYSDARILERYALATLYFSTQGPSWSNNTGWLSYGPTVSECSWAYVDCQFGDRVEAIIMENNGLVGELPEEIFHHLNSLFELSLSHNQGLSGTLSEDLGTSLGWFRIHDANLIGTLPNKAFERLSRLRSIHLYRNQFTGSITESIYGLKDLQVLRLNSNRLTGSLSSAIGGLLNLESLWLNHNMLTSSLPSELGELFRLDTVYLHRNDFDGEIPAELGHLTKLSDITFEGNAFTSMPEEICSLRDANLDRLVADCRTGSEYHLPCDCCTTCCRDGKKCIDT